MLSSVSSRRFGFADVCAASEKARRNSRVTAVEIRFMARTLAEGGHFSPRRHSTRWRDPPVPPLRWRLTKPRGHSGWARLGVHAGNVPGGGAGLRRHHRFAGRLPSARIALLLTKEHDLLMTATLEVTHPFDAARAAGREPFKVKDLSEAALGRNEIRLAEHEMPGLMSVREKFGKEKPLRGAKVMGSLHMTIQTAVLIETLDHLGADVRWVSCK